MRIEDAIEEMPDFECFRKESCDNCTNDWYCPGDCDFLIKASKISFERLQKCYARNDGDWQKISRYVNRAKVEEVIR
jgi:hypothetical protein